MKDDTKIRNPKIRELLGFFNYMVKELKLEKERAYIYIMEAYKHNQEKLSNLITKEASNVYSNFLENCTIKIKFMNEDEYENECSKFNKLIGQAESTYKKRLSRKKEFCSYMKEKLKFDMEKIDNYLSKMTVELYEIPTNNKSAIKDLKNSFEKNDSQDDETNGMLKTYIDFLECALARFEMQYKFSHISNSQNNESVDNKEFFEKQKELAEKGDTEAQYHLGLCYYYGNGTEKDYDKAIKYYMEAAKHGHDEAMYNLAKCYHDSNGKKPHLKNLADCDIAVAQYLVAERYFYHSSNHSELSRDWYEKAAKQGYLSALGALIKYMSSKSCDNFDWYKRHADEGNIYYQCQLGYFYFYGNGVEKNYVEANKWLEKVKNKIMEEDKNADLEKMILGYVERYYKKAFKEKLDNLLELSKRYMYCQELRTEVMNIVATARDDINKAVLKEKKDTLEDGINYYENEDFENAVAYFEEFSEQNDPKAKYYLGKCYYYGDGVETNKGKAWELIKEAAKDGSEDAQNFINWYYELDYPKSNSYVKNKKINSSQIRTYAKSISKKSRPKKTFKYTTNEENAAIGIIPREQQYDRYDATKGSSFQAPGHTRYRSPSVYDSMD